VLVLDNNGESELDAPRFAAYNGIPLDDGIDADREVDQADDVADGVVQGILENGTPYIGSPNAPIVVAEFGDFSCPHCASFEPEVDLLIERYVRSGQLRFEFHPMTFVGGEYSIIATQGAICAAEQGAFWEFHKDVFQLQRTDGAQSFTASRMEELATDLGLDGDDLRSCMNSNLPDRALAAADELASQYGVTATPTLLYRTQDATGWTRFFDENGQPVSRPQNQELYALIEELNATDAS
jgi:protein-disulfide isomerase